MGNEVSSSQIVGAFTGWTGSSIYKLHNGEMWQQARYYYYYYYSYQPRATVYDEGGSYVMRVDGCSVDMEVKRVR